MNEAPLYLLDTNILVHYVRGGHVQQRIEAEYRLLATPEAPLLCYVSEAEIRSLAVQLGWEAVRLNQLGYLLTMVRRIHIHEPHILQAYVAIDSHSVASGVTMGKNDLWIAAVAHVTGATLLTTDRDFDHLQERYLLRHWIDPSTESG
mgnify:CR=1 FL=1